MINLLLAILSSAMVSILMRIGEPKFKNTMAMFLANYTVCSLVSLFYMGGQPLLPRGNGIAFTLALGIAGGVLFLTSFAMLRINIPRNGVVLSAIFMKLGVLVPMVIAIVFFREVPRPVQILGFLLAVCAIVIVNLDGGRISAPKNMGLLLLLLLLGGLADSLINIYDKVGVPDWKDHFLFYIFLFAGILCLILLLVKRQPVGYADVLFGLIIGIPNYFSSRFLMLSLSSLPAIVAYPVYNVATIVLITLTGVLAFREKLSRQKMLGIVLILAALVLLNV